MNVSIPKIIEELNIENGSNYKISVLKKHQDNELLQRVLKMAYDKVTFTYGISMKNISFPKVFLELISLNTALDELLLLTNRTKTGNDAIKYLEVILTYCDSKDARIIEGIINRDLRINLGRTNINKVFKKLIVKPPYSRCLCTPAHVFAPDNTPQENDVVQR